MYLSRSTRACRLVGLVEMGKPHNHVRCDWPSGASFASNACRRLRCSSVIASWSAMAASRRALARPFDRPGLAALFDYARPGDTLAIIRLDRLGRSPAPCRPHLSAHLSTAAANRKRSPSTRSSPGIRKPFSSTPERPSTDCRSKSRRRCAPTSIAGFWPTGSCGPVVRTAGRAGRLPFPATSGGSALPAAAGAWPIRRRACSTRCCQLYRSTDSPPCGVVCCTQEPMSGRKKACRIGAELALRVEQMPRRLQ